MTTEISSQLFATNAALRDLAAGNETLDQDGPEDAVLLIKVALLALGFQLSDDGWSSGLSSAEDAIASFRKSRGLTPGTTIDQPTLSRLDYELNYLEGNVEEAMLSDPLLLQRDPLMGSIIG